MLYCYNKSITQEYKPVNDCKSDKKHGLKGGSMKKIISMALVITFAMSLAACQTKQEGQFGVRNGVTGYEAVLKTDGSIDLPKPGDDIFAFTSDKSLQELQQMLKEKNPAIDFWSPNGLDEDREFIVRYNAQCPAILFSQRVSDKSGNPLDNVWVVASEAMCYLDVPLDEETFFGNIFYPVHMIDNHYYIYDETDGGYRLHGQQYNPFSDWVELTPSETLFTDLAEFYQYCGYGIHYDGGNGMGGVIFVLPPDTAPDEGEELFRINVVKNGERYAMRYEAGKSDMACGAEDLIIDYMTALNTKDEQTYLSCSKNFDETSVEIFLNKCKSCTLEDMELYFADDENEQYIFRVQYEIVAENGEILGSLGTGEHSLAQYFMIGYEDGKPQILGQYFVYYIDCVTSTEAYLEYRQKGKTNDQLIDWKKVL